MLEIGHATAECRLSDVLCFRSSLDGSLTNDREEELQTDRVDAMHGAPLGPGWLRIV